MSGLGRALILAGLVLAGLGVLLTLGLGRLPGDMVLRRGNLTVYFPLVTSILLSLVLTLLLTLFRR
ncbi:MAG: DUF2905 family protein [bacterium]|nr:DUF2905 family protein [bacterium]